MLNLVHTRLSVIACGKYNSYGSWRVCLFMIRDKDHQRILAASEIPSSLDFDKWPHGHDNVGPMLGRMPTPRTRYDWLFSACWKFQYHENDRKQLMISYHLTDSRHARTQHRSCTWQTCLLHILVHKYITSKRVLLGVCKLSTAPSPFPNLIARFSCRLQFDSLYIRFRCQNPPLVEPSLFPMFPYV